MSFFSAPFVALWRHRAILAQTTRIDLRGRFAGSVLGALWLVLYPLCFLAIYSFVFVMVLRVRFSDLGSEEYVLLVFCGLVPFLAFAEALSSGVGSVVANRSLIRNTLFPLELIPAKAVLGTQASQFVGLCLLVIAMAVVGRLAWSALLMPVIWLLQVLFTIGITWIASLLNVYFRELQTLVGIVNLALMMLSPIAYTADMVPEVIRPVIALNPLYHLIQCYRDLLFFGTLPHGGSLWILVAISLLSFSVGFWFMKRVKVAFLDNV